ncbi:protein KTI12 homolog [Sorex fumeus]|uniref:protein KTI12 homolog n=1 Tax=Sorex fumeus TaxID=62283 RepID=UPI0024AE2D23|nr:protein KTI12 homolog [Sorex fumeus]
MPLVVFCGLPYSGRSRRAEQLRGALAAAGHAVHVVDDAAVLGAEDAAAYGDPAREKALRGALRAAVERRLSRHDVVLLDSLNYIKGFRYELYCLARAARTPLCLVYCVRPADPAGDGRAQPPGPEDPESPGTPDPGRSLRSAAGAFYPPELLEALKQRFEVPDSRNRWDRPLFTLVGSEEPLPLADIRAALFENRAPPPHQATQSQPLASGCFLHQLDQVTSQVLTGLLEAQKSAVPGDVLKLPGATEHLRFTRPLTLAELSRLRRQFISYTKMHPNNENLPQLANMFLQYLNQSLH